MSHGTPEAESSDSSRLDPRRVWAFRGRVSGAGAKIHAPGQFDHAANDAVDRRGVFVALEVVHHGLREASEQRVVLGEKRAWRGKREMSAGLGRCIAS